MSVFLEGYEWAVSNKEWLFSGAGVLVVGGIFSFLYRKKNAVNMTQKVGKRSVVSMGGRDSSINMGDSNVRKERLKR